MSNDLPHSRVVRFLRLTLLFCAGFSAGPTTSIHAQTSRPVDSSPFDTAVLLVTDRSVQGELKIRTDQKDKIQALLEDVGRPIWVLRDWPPEKSRDRLEPLIEQFESGLKPILTKQQRQRLLQIMLQHRGPDGLLRPEIVKVLGVSQDQLEELRSILGETHQKLQALGNLPADEEAAKKHYQSAHDLRSTEQRRILAVLTSQQEKSWLALRGQRFDLSAVGPFAVPAPELEDAQAKEAWINSAPLSLAKRRGQVTVVHFWAFGCINCIHNYEWYKAWQKDFAAQGVTLIGIHTPETQSERDVVKLKAKAKENGLNYPILVDNQRRNWDAWGNNVWPSVYLVDRQGRVRYWWYGELKWGGRDAEKLMRGRIEELLAEKAPEPPIAKASPKK